MAQDVGMTFGRFDLRDLRVLHTEPDPDFDMAVALAARALRTPIAAFSVLDFEAGVSCLRAHFGTRFPVTERTEIPIDVSLTATLKSGHVIAISDTSRDRIAREHPFVRAQGIQSLLAAPVHCPAEDVVGLIGVHDRVPRIWTVEEKQVILGVARFCTDAILLRATLRTLGMLSLRERGIV